MICPTLRSLVAPACAAALLLPSVALKAADIAQWTYGDGQVAGAAAAPGAKIPSGAAITAGANASALVSLANGAQGTIVLAPGAAVTLAQAAIDGHNVLEITVSGGAAQVDLTNKGQYEQVLVQSGAMQVAVTGTLFLIEHAKNDSAYCALVRGHIKARNAALANATSSWMDLNAHQGVGTSDTGLAPADSLAIRPQMVGANGAPLGLRDQVAATAAPATAAASWHQDAATGMVVLNALHQNPAIAASIVAADPAGCAEGEASFSGAHPGEADHLVAAVAENYPALLASFVGLIAAADPAHCGERLTAAIVASPTQAPALTGAAVAGNPDQAVDLTVAAVVTDTKDAQAITASACAAAPAQTNTIVSAAQTLDPSITMPVAAASPKVAATPAPTPSSHGAPASGGNNGGGFALPESAGAGAAGAGAGAGDATAGSEAAVGGVAAGTLGAGSAFAAAALGVDAIAGIPSTPTFGPGSNSGGVPVGGSVGPTANTGTSSSFTSPSTTPAVSPE
jgi:hypothetical protein